MADPGASFEGSFINEVDTYISDDSESLQPTPPPPPPPLPDHSEDDLQTVHTTHSLLDNFTPPLPSDSIHLHRQRLNRFHQSARSILSSTHVPPDAPTPPLSPPPSSLPRSSTELTSPTNSSLDDINRVKLDTLRLARFHQQAVSFLDRAYANEPSTLITEEQLSPTKSTSSSSYKLHDREMLQSFHHETMNILNAAASAANISNTNIASVNNEENSDATVEKRKIQIIKRSSTASSSAEKALLRIERDKKRLEQHYQDTMSFLNRAEKDGSSDLIEEQEIETVAVDRLQLQKYAREAMSFLDKAFRGDSSVMVDDENENEYVGQPHDGERDWDVERDGHREIEMRNTEHMEKEGAGNQDVMKIVAEGVEDEGKEHTEVEMRKQFADLVDNPNRDHLNEPELEFEQPTEPTQRRRQRTGQSSSSSKNRSKDNRNAPTSSSDIIEEDEVEINVVDDDPDVETIQRVSSNRRMFKNVRSSKRAGVGGVSTVRRSEEARQIAEDRAALERYDEEVGDFLGMAYDNDATIIVDDVDSETSNTTGGGRDGLYARRLSPSSPSADSSSYVHDDEVVSEDAFTDEEFQDEEQLLEVVDSKQQEQARQSLEKSSGSDARLDRNASLQKRMVQYEREAADYFDEANVSEEEEAGDMYDISKSVMVKNFHQLRDDDDDDKLSPSHHVDKISKSDSFKPKAKPITKERRKRKEPSVDVDGRGVAGDGGPSLADANIKSNYMMDNDVVEDDDSGSIISGNKNLAGLLEEEAENEKIREFKPRKGDDGCDEILQRQVQVEPEAEINLGQEVGYMTKNLSPTARRQFSPNASSDSAEEDVKMDLRLEDRTGRSGGWRAVPLATSFYRQIPRGSTIKLRQRPSLLVGDEYRSVEQSVGSGSGSGSGSGRRGDVRTDKRIGMGDERAAAALGFGSRAGIGAGQLIPASALQRVEKERDGLMAMLEKIVNERSMLAAQVKEMNSIFPERLNSNLDDVERRRQEQRYHHGSGSGSPTGSLGIEEIDIAAELREAHAVMSTLTEEMEETLSLLERRNKETLNRAHKAEERGIRLESDSYRMEGELKAQERRMKQAVEEERKLRDLVEKTEDKFQARLRKSNRDIEIMEQRFRDESDEQNTRIQDLKEEIGRLEFRVEEGKKQHEQLESQLEEQKKQNSSNISARGLANSVKRSMEGEILILKRRLDDSERIRSEERGAAKAKREELEEKWREREKETMQLTDARAEKMEEGLENEMERLKKESKKLKSENVKLSEQSGVMERRRAVADREAEEARRRQRVAEVEVSQIRTRFETSMKERISKLDQTGELIELQKSLQALRDGATKREETLEKQLQEFRERAQAAETAAGEAEKGAKKAAEMAKLVQERGQAAVEAEREMREKAESERAALAKEKGADKEKVQEEKEKVSSSASSSSGAVEIVKSSSRRTLRKSSTKNRDAEKDKRKREKKENGASTDAANGGAYGQQRKRSSYRAMFFG